MRGEDIKERKPYRRVWFQPRHPSRAWVVRTPKCPLKAQSLDVDVLGDMAPSTLFRRTLAATLLACSVAVLLVPTPAAAGTPAEDEYAFLQKHNQARASAGVPAMTWDAELAVTARSWSQHMASQGQISHDPGLAEDANRVEPDWRSVGENVGVGYSVTSLFDAFMNSSGHRANILKSAYNRVGIGVVHSGGKIWVTVRFLQGPAISGTTGTTLPGMPTALTGDFNGDGREDVLAYGPGSATDELWFGTATHDMVRKSVSVSGQYWAFTGDFDGDGKTSIFWYGPGSTADKIWTWNGTGWSSQSVNVGGVYQPLSGDFDDDGRDDVLWYGPGSKTDKYWYGTATDGFTAASTTVAGTYRPVVGNLDGRHGDDIFWYGPGSAGDYIFFSTGVRGRVTNVKQSVGGGYTPVSGDYNGNGVDDVLWYAPGTSQDATWYMSTTQGAHSTVLRTVNGQSYLPAAGDLNGNRADDVVWFLPAGAAGDPLWWSAPGSTSASPDTVS